MCISYPTHNFKFFLDINTEMHVSQCDDLSIAILHEALQHQRYQFFPKFISNPFIHYTKISSLFILILKYHL